jgi:hypothetical protein
VKQPSAIERRRRRGASSGASDAEAGGDDAGEIGLELENLGGGDRDGLLGSARGKLTQLRQFLSGLLHLLHGRCHRISLVLGGTRAALTSGRRAQHCGELIVLALIEPETRATSPST